MGGRQEGRREKGERETQRETGKEEVRETGREESSDQTTSHRLQLGEPQLCPHDWIVPGGDICPKSSVL